MHDTVVNAHFYFQCVLNHNPVPGNSHQYGWSSLPLTCVIAIANAYDASILMNGVTVNTQSS